MRGGTGNAEDRSKKSMGQMSRFDDTEDDPGEQWDKRCACGRDSRNRHACRH